MPAEWEPHEATWLGWPHNASDWPGKIAAIHFVYGEIVKKVAAGETVRIIVNDEKHEAKAAAHEGRSPIDHFELRPRHVFRIPPAFSERRGYHKGTRRSGTICDKCT